MLDECPLDFSNLTTLGADTWLAAQPSHHNHRWSFIHPKHGRWFLISDLMASHSLWVIQTSMYTVRKVKPSRVLLLRVLWDQGGKNRKETHLAEWRWIYSEKLEESYSQRQEKSKMRCLRWKKREHTPLTLTACGSHGCELDWIWNQLKDKLVGTPVREILIRLLEVGRPTGNVCGSFWGQPR